MLYSTANFETNLEKFRTVGGKLTSDVSDSSFIYHNLMYHKSLEELIEPQIQPKSAALPKVIELC